MIDVTKLSDEDLIKETHRLASSVSYYNAAEGNWSAERSARQSANRDFRDAMNEMKNRDIEFENRGYLL